MCRSRNSVITTITTIIDRVLLVLISLAINNISIFLFNSQKTKKSFIKKGKSTYASYVNMFHEGNNIQSLGIADILPNNGQFVDVFWWRIEVLNHWKYSFDFIQNLTWVAWNAWRVPWGILPSVVSPWD